MNWQAISNQTFELGESPFWHTFEQMLYWVDIPGKKILRTRFDSANATRAGAIDAWDMPSDPGCIAPAASGGLVIALRNGVFRARQWGGALEPMATLPYDTTRMRANDGKCDALGRFWIGTLDESKAVRDAGLFCLDRRAGNTLAAQPKIDTTLLQATTGNGLAWSLDGKTLYWADTGAHTVYAWDFDLQSSHLSNLRPFASFAPKPAAWQFDPAPDNGGYRGRPDGAAIDIEGNYYCAMFEGRRLCKFAPNGTLLAEIATPAQCPTMPCLGGEDFKTLFITTARHGRSAAELQAFPQSGAVFAMRVDVAGMPVNQFIE